MKLIRYENYQIVIADELLLIRPARQLLNADRTAAKENFLRQISYMYFMYDPESTYGYLTDEAERAKAVIEQEGLGKDFKPDKKLEELIEIYKRHVITTSYLLLQDNRIAIDKIREFLRNVDLTQVDDKGKPVYPINQVTATIKMVPELAAANRKAEKDLAKEMEENSRARGIQEKKLFEDGLDIN